VKAWRGQIPSWQVFWISGVAVLLGVNVAIYFELSRDLREHGYINPGTIIGHSIAFSLYLTFLAVSLWRSARSSAGAYKILARIGAAWFAFGVLKCVYMFLVTVAKL
jgi:hypothetical protein